MSQDSSERLSLDCPKCGSFLKIRTSKQMTPVYRVLYLYCTNTENCGHRFKGEIEMTHTLVPSKIPNPEINLPLDPSVVEQFEQMGYEIKEAKPSAS